MKIETYMPKHSIELSNHEDKLVAKLGENIDKWVDKGYTTPGQCFIFMDGNVIFGGVVFTSFEEQELEIMDFAFTEKHSESASQLLKSAIEKARNIKHEYVCYDLYSSDSSFKRTLSLFKDAGFIIEQEKKNYIFDSKELPDLQNRLAYVPLAETGMDKFVQAIAEVTKETLDSLMLKDAQKFGDLKAAKQYANSLVNICPDTSLWHLAYADNELIGLIVPQFIGDGMGIINYIGVVPARRGNNCGYDLLLFGTDLLLKKGATEIIADIDKDNLPLEESLVKAGFKFKYNECVLIYNF